MIKLVGSTIPESCDTVVKVLEDLLVRAKEGELTQVAIAYVTSDASVGGDFAAVRHQHLATLIGALERCKARVMWRMDQD
jgi:hypothetical protein